MRIECSIFFKNSNKKQKSNLRKKLSHTEEYQIVMEDLKKSTTFRYQTVPEDLCPGAGTEE